MHDFLYLKHVYIEYVHEHAWIMYNLYKNYAFWYLNSNQNFFLLIL